MSSTSEILPMDLEKLSRPVGSDREMGRGATEAKVPKWLFHGSSNHPCCCFRTSGPNWVRPTAGENRPCGLGGSQGTSSILLILSPPQCSLALSTWRYLLVHYSRSIYVCTYFLVRSVPVNRLLWSLLTTQ